MKNTLVLPLLSLFLLAACSPALDQPPQMTAAPLAAPIATSTLQPAVSAAVATQNTSGVPARAAQTLLVINSEPAVNVRAGPGTYYPVVGSVHNNDQLPVTGTDEQLQWVQFTFPAAPDGVAWIYAPYTSFDRAANALPVVTRLPTPPVTPTPAPPRAMGKVKVVNPGGQVNVRAGPGTTYALVGKVNNGGALSATGTIESGDWVQFQFSGSPDGVAWIFTDYTDYDRSSNTLPLITDLPPTPVP